MTHADAHIWALQMDMADEWKKRIAIAFFRTQDRSLPRDTRTKAEVDLKFLLFGCTLSGGDIDAVRAAERTIKGCFSPSFRKELSDTYSSEYSAASNGDVLPLDFSSSSDRHRITASLTVSCFLNQSVSQYVRARFASSARRNFFFSSIRRGPRKFNTVGAKDVIQYLAPSLFKDILIPYSFAQVMGFVEEHTGPDESTVHCVILPLVVKEYSSPVNAWSTNIDDADCGTTIEIPSEYTSDDLRLFPVSQSVRRLGILHKCDSSCRYSSAGPAHSGSLDSGGTFTVLQRHHGFPPHSG